MTEDSTIVLTGISIDREQLLVVPLGWAVEELSTWATLINARTFGQVRQDAEAARLVAEYAGQYLERLFYDEEEPDTTEQLHERAFGDDVPFDVTAYFSEDDIMVWQGVADPRRSTAEWMLRAEPELFVRYSRPDTGWGPNYEPSPWIAPRDRDALELELKAAGHRVRHLDALESIYLDPPADYELRLQAAYNPDLILTALTGSGDRLLVIPLAQALEEVAVYDEREIEVDDTGDEIESEDNSKPTISTHEWLLAAEPDLLARYANEDNDIGFSDYESVPWLAPAYRTEIEAELVRRGYEVRQVTDLAFHYMYPPATADDLLRDQ